MREKTENIVIRVTPTQRAVIEEAARLNEETLSEFVRRVVLTAARKEVKRRA